MIIELDDTLAEQCALTQDDARNLLALALQRLRGVTVQDAGALLGMSVQELMSRTPPAEVTPDFGVDDVIRAPELVGRDAVEKTAG